MAVGHRYRCLNCDQVFAVTNTSPCSNCQATTWEPCVVDTAPGPSVPGIYRHHSGVAFCAYEEAAKAQADIPGWVVPLIPTDSAARRRQQLVDQIASAIDANTAFLAIPTPTQAQGAAQVKAMTRQWNAYLRLYLGVLDSVD